MNSMLENFINGNIKTARVQARRHKLHAISETLRTEYGYTAEKALLTAIFLKTGEGWQEACDA